MWSAQQTQNICITFDQRRPNVVDGGPTLYKCYTNVLCLLEWLLLGVKDQKREAIKAQI